MEERKTDSFDKYGGNSLDKITDIGIAAIFGTLAGITSHRLNCDFSSTFYASSVLFATADVFGCSLFPHRHEDNERFRRAYVGGLFGYFLAYAPDVFFNG